MGGRPVVLKVCSSESWHQHHPGALNTCRFWGPLSELLSLTLGGRPSAICARMAFTALQGVCTQASASPEQTLVSPALTFLTSVVKIKGHRHMPHTESLCRNGSPSVQLSGGSSSGGSRERYTGVLSDGADTATLGWKQPGTGSSPTLFWAHETEGCLGICPRASPLRSPRSSFCCPDCRQGTCKWLLSSMQWAAL